MDDFRDWQVQIDVDRRALLVGDGVVEYAGSGLSGALTDALQSWSDRIEPYLHGPGRGHGWPRADERSAHVLAQRISDEIGAAFTVAVPFTSARVSTSGYGQNPTARETFTLRATASDIDTAPSP